MMEKMILVDLETQDFRVETGIYEVACMVIEDDQIVDTLYLGKEIKGYSGSKKYGRGFHNICADSESIKAFQSFLEKYPYPLVAHNCPFDRKFLVYYDWISEDYPTFCSMKAIRYQMPKLDGYSMSYLKSYFNISDEGAHTAMGDIKALYEILLKVKPERWSSTGNRKSGSKTQTYAKPKPREFSEIQSDVERSNRLNHECICFTGKSQFSRVTMQELALLNGAKISNDITPFTTMLVVGQKAGSKLDRAQEMGISIISDEEFMKLIKG